MYDLEREQAMEDRKLSTGTVEIGEDYGRGVVRIGAREVLAADVAALERFADSGELSVFDPDGPVGAEGYLRQAIESLTWALQAGAAVKITAEAPA